MLKRSLTLVTILFLVGCGGKNSHSTDGMDLPPDGNAPVGSSIEVPSTGDVNSSEIVSSGSGSQSGAPASGTATSNEVASSGSGSTTEAPASGTAPSNEVASSGSGSTTEAPASGTAPSNEVASSESGSQSEPPSSGNEVSQSSAPQEETTVAVVKVFNAPLVLIRGVTKQQQTAMDTAPGT